MNVLERIVRKIKGTLSLTSRSWSVRMVRPLYESVLNATYGRRGLVRVINGQERILVRPAHRYADENYEPKVYDFIKSAVIPGSVVLDVGAHVGLFTILMARWAGASGHVHAFEPAAQTRASLEEHLVLNGVRDRVTAVPSAVSDTVGSATFYVAPNSPENTLSSSHSRLPSAAGTQVSMTTIDRYCEEFGVVPTLIKIDIEGFELHALRGARRVLQRDRPIVVVEMHPMNWPEIGVEPERFASTVAELGYKMKSIDGQSDPLVEYGHVVLEPLN